MSVVLLNRVCKREFSTLGTMNHICMVGVYTQGYFRTI